MEDKETQSKKEGENKGLPFNPQDLEKEFNELIKDKFGGHVQVMSVGGNPFTQAHAEEVESDDEFETLENISAFNYKPKEIKKYLDRFVIGQDEAKKALSIAVCDHYNHLKSEVGASEESSHYQKQNVLILGPTGVGKTYLVKLISELIGVPFVKADATRFSEVGYMGANVDDVIRDLVQKAGGQISKAENGIVYVDEIDKLASKKDHQGRDVSGRGVQFGFLRLLENTDVDLNASHDMASQFKTFMSFQKKGKAEKEIVNTKNILFIFSGAFHGLEEVVENRLSKSSIGIHTSYKKMDSQELMGKVQSEDLVHYGFEHEFIGRLPIRVACHPLSEVDLFAVLHKSEHSIVKQYIEAFKSYGVELTFTKGALQELARRAHQQKTGARALSAAFEKSLRVFKFELPSSSVKKLEVNEELIKNPEGYLHHLLKGEGMFS